MTQNSFSTVALAVLAAAVSTRVATQRGDSPAEAGAVATGLVSQALFVTCGIMAEFNGTQREAIANALVRAYHLILADDSREDEDWQLEDADLALFLAAEFRHGVAPACEGHIPMTVH